ncbi:MAG: DNA helicase PcrA [Stomatobaculum sp.]|nr:DNA helicase PcrA [Stomatobaculum sp.]
MALYDNMNDRQKEAMLCTEGPLLIIAGAGSGKTRVLTHRIAWLIESGITDPWHILAITFTNKAAGEMRQRVDSLVKEGADQVWVATFHSTCVRILRRFIDRIGYENGFTIYDTDDQKTLMKQVFKDLRIDPRSFRERNVLAAISSAKNELIGPDAFAKEAVGYAEEKQAECYREYQKRLHKNNALDFDDLIMMTVKLLKACPDVLDYYRNRFRYILVDEYQDTNTAQFRLVELLAGGHRNLCVVGDDDQSIYKFRGANIENILNFEEAFPGAKVVKLEQNYRSNGNILEAANSVIRNNRGRRDKKLWTEQETGEKIRVMRFETAQDEADAVSSEILKASGGIHYSSFAVLYRTNAQSRLLEEKFVTKGIPYQLVGGVNFYQRREIKDVLAYLRTIANGSDDIAVRRILNVPKRGIGNTTADKIADFAAANGISFWQGLLDAPGAGIAGRADAKIRKFTDMIEEFRRKSADMPLDKLIAMVAADSGYTESLKEEGEIEAESRIENIDELISKAASYEAEGPDLSDRTEEGLPADLPLLNRFLEEVSLVADIDSLDEDSEKVTLMTLHAAKGLEFDEVYMTGMEDGLFPGNRSIDDPKELEEERRLCYVGITRAKRRLTMTSAKSRMINGETRWSNESMFVREIPEELKERADRSASSAFRKPVQPSYSGGYGSGASGRTGSSGGSGSPAHRYPWESASFASSGDPGRKRPAPAFGKQFQVVKADHLDYAEGDRVRHTRFGAGTILKIVDGGRDFEVTVDFDGHGVKKMFAGFAKLQKL